MEKIIETLKAIKPWQWVVLAVIIGLVSGHIQITVTIGSSSY